MVSGMRHLQIIWFDTYILYFSPLMDEYTKNRRFYACPDEPRSVVRLARTETSETKRAPQMQNKGIS